MFSSRWSQSKGFIEFCNDPPSCVKPAYNYWWSSKQSWPSLLPYTLATHSAQAYICEWNSQKCCEACPALPFRHIQHGGAAVSTGHFLATYHPTKKLVAGPESNWPSRHSDSTTAVRVTAVGCRPILPYLDGRVSYVNDLKTKAEEINWHTDARD
jgi:hypothetical protein